MVDITLAADAGFFNYRVGAIILSNDGVLMVKNANHPYYYSVGGRVRFGETAEDAVLREACEETKLTFEIDRLAFIHENFFVGGFGEPKPFHEIALFFLMKPHHDIGRIQCQSIGADGGDETLHWLPLDTLADCPVYPEFFRSELKNLSREVRRFVTRDNATVRVG